MLIIFKWNIEAKFTLENSLQDADASQRCDLTHVNFPASSRRVDTVARANRLFCSSAVNACSTR